MSWRGSIVSGGVEGDSRTNGHRYTGEKRLLLFLCQEVQRRIRDGVGSIEKQLHRFAHHAMDIGQIHSVPAFPQNRLCFFQSVHRETYVHAVEIEPAVFALIRALLDENRY